MTLVAVTQRVGIDPRHGERRDMLDQRWAAFLHACGLTPLPVPNDPATAILLVTAAAPHGLILTGGNNLVRYGGDAPERDATERALLAWMQARDLPVLGICRGAQVLVDAFGGDIEPIDGHVATWHDIVLDGQIRRVNSFHGFGSRRVSPPLIAKATAADGVVEALCHASAPIHGRMWHPERMAPFDPLDIAFFRSVFGVFS